MPRQQPRTSLTPDQRAYCEYVAWCSWMDLLPADFETWRKTTANINAFNYVS